MVKKKQSPPTFYVLHGNDEYSRKSRLKDMQEKMNDPSGLNITFMDGAKVNVMTVINTVGSMPFLSDRRLVIVEGMLERLGKRSKENKAELDILLAELPHLPEFARLVFHENITLPDKHPVIAFIKKGLEGSNGYEKAFNVPRDPMRWIIKQAESAYGVKIEPGAASALAAVIGADLRQADSELAKLAASVNYERPITENDVAQMTPHVSQETIFEMVDAIAHRDAKVAMTIAQKFLDDNQQPLALFGMINRQFRLLILAREYLDERGNPSDMAAALKVHPFVAKKLSQQVKEFRDLNMLENIYRSLAESDFHIKSGQMNDILALQLFIARITR